MGPRPGRGATGCGDARPSGAHPPLRTAAACTHSERRRTPRPRKPARPRSAGRRDHRGLVGWQWWAARCCSAGDSAAARRVASAADHTPGCAAEGSGPPAARHGKFVAMPAFLNLGSCLIWCVQPRCTTSATATDDDRLGRGGAARAATTPRTSSRRSSVEPPAVAREAVLSRPIGFAFSVTGPDGGAGRRRPHGGYLLTPCLWQRVVTPLRPYRQEVNAQPQKHCPHTLHEG